MFSTIGPACLNSCSEKSNSGGKSLPLGNLQVGSLSSSKKGWLRPSIGFSLFVGEYWSICETRSMASGVVRERKTLCQGWGLIWGNLNSGVVKQKKKYSRKELV